MSDSIASHRPHLYRQTALLASLQGLLITNSGTLIAVAVLAGMSITHDPTTAVLPATGYALGSALSTYIASQVMRRVGRQSGFTIAGIFCVIGALVAAAAVALASIWLLFCGTMIIGVYNAFGQYYRYAAADLSQKFDPAFKERAIALVLTGGLAGALLGPETSKLTVDLFATRFMGPYLMLIFFAVIAMVLVRNLDLPMPTAAEQTGPERPLATIARQPAFLVAVLGTMLSYGIMNLLMTATPLAMNVCGFPFGDSAFVLSWHIVGMYAPGFFTGNLIRRFGMLTIMFTGIVILAACALVAMAGISLVHFWLADFLLGVGWNFMFVAATALLTETYQPAEKAKVQGINDSLMFGTMISTSLGSGAMFSASGWNLINLYVLPFLAVFAVAVLALGWHRGRRVAPRAA